MRRYRNMGPCGIIDDAVQADMCSLEHGITRLRITVETLNPVRMVMVIGRHVFTAKRDT